MTDSTPRDSGPRVAIPILRVGYLALTDAAPIIVAEELGLFAAQGVQVDLRREIGWATIRDKIIYGELDAAQAPAPMLWSTQLGLGCPATDVRTAHVLNLHGNALTLSRALWDKGVRAPSALADHLRRRSSASPLTFGVVFRFSQHHILLRTWLREGGVDPDRDVRIVVVPPAQMFRNLAAGTIDGFCAGEPWNTLAVREGAGCCPTWSAAAQPGAVEKVLMVTRAFADARPTAHAALVRALSAAAAWCDEPHNRERVAEILASPRHLNLPLDVVMPSLAGRFSSGGGHFAVVPDFHVFHRGGANVPTPEKAGAVQRALATAGLLPAPHATDPDLPRRLFRDDLHREFLHPPTTHEPSSTPVLRGVGSVSG